MADLITNRPGGFIEELTGVVLVEGGTFRLKFVVTDDQTGDPVDLTGYTVDSAGMSWGNDFASVANFTVKLGVDGVVTVEAGLAFTSASMVPVEQHPNGRPAKLWVRLKDPSTYPFYLIAPSWVTIKHGPGASV